MNYLVISHKYCTFVAKLLLEYDRQSDMNALYNASIQDENSLGFASSALPEVRKTQKPGCR